MYGSFGENYIAARLSTLYLDIQYIHTSTYTYGLLVYFSVYNTVYTYLSIYSGNGWKVCW